MKILIIEDERGIAAVLRRGLERQYTVELASTGAEGLMLAASEDHGVILLDLNLPDMPGVVVCRTLRQEGVVAPILVLTAEDCVQQKVTLLDAGADDYLTKPFRIEELKARLRVLSRRNGKEYFSSRLMVGDLEMDVATRRVDRRGSVVQLRRKEFEILEYLMHHAGAAVSRATLLEQLWSSDGELSTNVVDVHIKYLRDKIDRAFPDTEPMITTVHGIGYRLETSSRGAKIPQRKEVSRL